jgi:hypothetical protein
MTLLWQPGTGPWPRCAPAEMRSCLLPRQTLPWRGKNNTGRYIRLRRKRLENPRSSEQRSKRTRGAAVDCRPGRTVCRDQPRSLSLRGGRREAAGHREHQPDDKYPSDQRSGARAAQRTKEVMRAVDRLCPMGENAKPGGLCNDTVVLKPTARFSRSWTCGLCHLRPQAAGEESP